MYGRCPRFHLADVRLGDGGSSHIGNRQRSSMNGRLEVRHLGPLEITLSPLGQGVARAFLTVLEDPAQPQKVGRVVFLAVDFGVLQRVGVHAVKVSAPVGWVVVGKNQEAQGKLETAPHPLAYGGLIEVAGVRGVARLDRL